MPSKQTKDETRQPSPELDLLPQERAQQPLATIPQQAAPVATITPMDLISQALNRGASVEQIGQLMDLMQRQRDAEAKQAFVAAMVSFKRNPPTILKNHLADFKSRNEGRVSYTYADLADVCDALVSSLAANGISHDWTTSQPNGLVSVTCTITHELGHSKSTTLSAGADQTGGKNAIQAVGSAVSYLERYTLLAVCGIAVRDGSDNDGNDAGLDGNAVKDAVAESRRRNTPKPSEVAAANQQGTPPTDDLLKRARAAADKGPMVFGDFFRGISADERKSLNGELKALQERAAKSTHKAD